MNRDKLIIAISCIMILLCLTGCKLGKEDNADKEPLKKNISDDSAIGVNEDITNNSEDEVKKIEEKAAEDDETISQTAVTQKHSKVVPVEYSDKLFIDTETLEVFIQKEIEEQVITKLPQKMIEYYQYEKEIPENQILFSDNLHKYQVEQCVLFISDSRIDMYDINEDRWNNLVEKADVYNVQYDDKLKTVSYYDSKLYGVKFIFDSKTSSFKPFVTRKEHFLPVARWKDKVYINDEYSSDNFKDYDRYVIHNNSYITIEIDGKEYHISDSFQVNDDVYFIEYETRYLYKVNNEDNVSVVIEKPINTYDFFSAKMVFNSYGFEMGLLYFDFTNDVLIVLNNDDNFIDLKISKNYIVGINMNQQVYIYNVDNIPAHTVYEIPIDSTVEYHYMPQLEVDNEHLYLSLDRTIHVVDLKTMDIIDRFGGRELSVADNQRVFYSMLGNLLEYNPVSQTHELIDMAGYAIQIYPFMKELLVYEGVDGPGEYTLHDMNTRWLENNYPESLNADYILFYRSTEFSSQLMVYDRTKRRLELVIHTQDSVDYHVVDNQLRYREKYYADGKMQYREWYEYNIEKGSSVYDINEVVERTRRDIQQNINQGYIDKEEVYEADNGRFIIYANPYYNDGKWDEKGLAVFVFGAHGKGYSMWCDDFRVDSSIKLDKIVPNKTHDRCYVVYEMDQKKMIALFRIIETRFNVVLEKTQEIIGECQWAEDGETIEFNE